MKNWSGLRSGWVNQGVHLNHFTGFWGTVGVNFRPADAPDAFHLRSGPGAFDHRRFD